MWARAGRTTSRSSAAAICGVDESDVASARPHSREPRASASARSAARRFARAAAIVRAQGRHGDPPRSCACARDGLPRGRRRRWTSSRRTRTRRVVLGWQPESPEQGPRPRGNCVLVVLPRRSSSLVQGTRRRRPGHRNHHSAFKVIPIDTVAAATASRAASLTRWNRARPLEQVLRYAAAGGALSTRRRKALRAAAHQGGGRGFPRPRLTIL